jgi:Na+-translocating ferredoxin:NAD+ oxidoreductase RnfC subunit
VDTILLNCAECEPLLKVHRQVLEEYTEEIKSVAHHYVYDFSELLAN